MSSEQSALAAQKEQARKKRRDDGMWKAVLGTVHGRYVINCILEEMTHCNHMSFVAENPHLTSFREGERHVGNLIMARAFTNRQNFFTIMRDEHLAREQGDKNAAAK